MISYLGTLPIPFIKNIAVGKGQIIQAETSTFKTTWKDPSLKLRKFFTFLLLLFFLHFIIPLHLSDHKASLYLLLSHHLCNIFHPKSEF